MSLWEDSNHAVLHDLHIRAIGDPYRILTAADTTANLTASDVSSVLWELPQRELGGELPAWQELQDQLALASASGFASHLDGARIRQTTPFYGRPLHEIAGAFESVYVSLYKDLGAPRGAMLAGSADFIASARRWRQRMGGTIDEAWPLALLALDGLRRLPELMPRAVAHAQTIAAEIDWSTAASVRPGVPHGAMFHVHLPVSAERAKDAHDQLIREYGFGLALRLRTSPDPERCWFEVTIGEDALTVEPGQVAEMVSSLIRAG